MSIDQIVRAYIAVESELVARGLLDVPEPPSAVLEHVVGRTVLYRGSDNDLPAMLTEQGYKVLSDDSVEATGQFDTVIVHGRDLSADQVMAYDAMARFSLILSDCKGDGLKARQITDGLSVTEKWGEQRPPSAISLVAMVHNRIRTATGWDYRLVLADGTEVRAYADTEYPRGATVAVGCSGVVADLDGGTGMGLLDGAVIRAYNDQPDVLLTESYELIVRASVEGCLSGARTLESSDLLSRLRVPLDKVDSAKRLLRGFAGTEDEARSLLDTRLGITSTIEHEDGLEIDVARFTEDDTTHSVVGVVLEPNTPYGPLDLWFPPEVIREIAATGPDQITSLNHRMATGCRITLSMIDEQGRYAKPGSWIVGCELSPELYAEIKAGTYRGFSIRGRATLTEGESA